jgi:CubicO group peptidase (beta-lactamase class C family)
MSAHLETHHIPGATVAMVKGGELLFAKGYGYADVEKREPVASDGLLAGRIREDRATGRQ